MQRLTNVTAVNQSIGKEACFLLHKQRWASCGHCSSGGPLSPSPLLRKSRVESQWNKPRFGHAERRASRPSTVIDVTSRVSTAASSSTSFSSSLPPLRCPGGPRVKAEGIKQLYKVPHAGYLAKYDQRFVLNLKLTHQLATYLSRTTLTTPDKLLLELGPGVGSLTRSLLTRPCVGVLGIELDERFNAHLEQIKTYTRGKFQWINGDILSLNELDVLKAIFPEFTKQHLRRPSADEARDGSGTAGAPLRSAERERLLRKREERYGRTLHHTTTSSAAEPGGAESARGAFQTSPNAAFDITDHWWSSGAAKVEVVANLPFDIITELLMRYATDCSKRTGLFSFGRVPIHVFTQREVAERIIAPPGSILFSRLSVLCQAYFHVRLKQTFVDQTYYPRTEVQGAMLTLEPRAVPLASGVDGSTLTHFTDLLMRPGLRASTVHKSLSQFAPPEVVQYLLQELRMDGAMTVIDLSVEEVTQLASMWHRFIMASQQQA